MANELLAKSAILKLDGVAIAKLTGWTLEVNKEAVDVTSLDSPSAWREFLVDIKDWSVSFDGIVTRTGTGDYEELLVNLLGTDTVLAFLIDDSVFTATDIGGNCFLTSLPISGALGDKQTFSGTLQGTGPLAIT